MKNDVSEELHALIAKRGELIRHTWLKRVIDTYPHDTSQFLLTQKDQFLNPVGSTLAREIDNLFREFLGDMESVSVRNSLDGIIRIRAVQDFSPSAAVGCISLLKTVLRETLMREILEKDLLEPYLALESRIDTMMNIGFDIYMTCREMLYDIKAKEARASVAKLLERMNRNQPSSPADIDDDRQDD